MIEISFCIYDNQTVPVCLIKYAEECPQQRSTESGAEVTITSRGDPVS